MALLTLNGDVEEEEEEEKEEEEEEEEKEEERLLIEGVLVQIGLRTGSRRRRPLLTTIDAAEDVGELQRGDPSHLPTLR